MDNRWIDLLLFVLQFLLFYGLPLYLVARAIDSLLKALYDHLPHMQELAKKRQNHQARDIDAERAGRWLQREGWEYSHRDVLLRPVWYHAQRGHSITQPYPGETDDFGCLRPWSVEYLEALTRAPPRPAEGPYPRFKLRDHNAAHDGTDHNV